MQKLMHQWWIMLEEDLDELIGSSVMHMDL